MEETPQQLPPTPILQTTPELKQLTKALASAQAEYRPLVRNKTNPHFQSDYADLQAGINATREALRKHELAVVQLPAVMPGVNGGARVEVTTILAHSSGQMIVNTLAIPLIKADAQGVGSAITYGRRYSYESITGLAPVDGDDDGNSASEKEQGKPVAQGQKKPEAAKQTATAKTPDEKTKAFLDAMTGFKTFLGDAKYEQVLKNQKFENAENITTSTDRNKVYKAMSLAVDVQNAAKKATGAA